MNKTSKQFAASIVFASGAWAQTEVAPPSPPSPENGSFSFKIISDRGAMDMKTVKGAPYSAEETTTTTQTLADGNRIVQTSTAKIYRDQQGRTRFEHSLGSIGAVGAAQKHTMIMIYDAVAGVHYTLDPENHVAHKAGELAEPGVDAKFRAEKLSAEKAQGNTTLTLSTSEGTRIVADYKPGVDLAMHSDNLGTQTVEGLQAAGTRTTTTIPAGAEGNEQPMQITDERWYSSDLQTNVKTIHTDPRMGQTVFVLSNVSRANPDPSLFQVPAEYQVSEGHGEPLIIRDSPPSQ